MTGSGRETGSKGMRIARYMARCGVGSRRYCETLVAAGEVTVNDERVTSPACNVIPEQDTVRLRDRLLKLEQPVYLLLNKPPGYTCSARDRHARRLVFELIPERYGRLFTVGRLDRDSEGLLLLTNDGRLAQRVAHPRYGILKTYRVTCRGQLTSAGLARLRRGVRDAGEWLRPTVVEVIRRGRRDVELEVVLGEGRKREVRRLCAAVGLRVARLLRERMGPLDLEGLAPGACRELTAAEVDALRAVGGGARQR